MPALDDHPLAVPPPLYAHLIPFTLPDQLFDGSGWSGVQSGGSPSLAELKLFSLRPSESPGYWWVSCIDAGGYAEQNKPVARWAVPFIFSTCWQMDPSRVAWTRLDPPPASPPRLAPPPPCVYFATTEGAPFVKVGWAKDPTKRLGELQTGCPFRLTLAATTPGSMADEFSLHRRFAALRIRPDGEWFHLRDELAEFLDTLTTEARHDG